MRALRVLPAVLLALGLAAGCGAHDGPADQPSSSAPSGYADMQKKVDAAESAAAEADRDARTDK
ncbi:hypothetical protein ABZ446_33075 [Streptomyces sp. NPDC005813]|uniref:hypothetical protein n=1 Tax=Streptomyces sp. NPDC005813 TaxID=3155592 RepID=UPI0033CD7F1D